MNTQNSARLRSPASTRPGPLSLRSQHKELTKSRLESAAIELFTENGYRSTSVGDIAKAAGTTPTTFYRYFTGKSDLARLLQEEISIEFRKSLENLDEMKRPTRGAVRAWIDQYGERWHRMHALCEAYWEATNSDPKLAGELVTITFKLTESMKMPANVREGDQKGKFQLRLVMMYLVMDRLYHLVHIQGRNSTSMSMLYEFSEIFRQALFSER